MRRERPQIGVVGIEIGGKDLIDCRHVLVEVERLPLPGEAENPFEQAVECRLVRTLIQRKSKRGGVARLGAARIARRDQCACRQIGRALVIRLHCRDLIGIEAGRSIAGRALHCRGIEASNRADR